MTEIKPCSKCGCKGILKSDGLNYQIKCINIKCGHRVGYYNDLEEVIDEWNEECQ